MHEWRITKYDPARRDASGAFLGDDWSGWSDIGNSFGGRELTPAAYLEMEDRYVAVARAFFREAGVPTVTVKGLEADVAPVPRAIEFGLAALLDEGAPLIEGRRLTEDGVGRAVRLMLRELLWCRLEAAGRFFLHVGYDYYLYVGSRTDLPESVDQARLLGLHVEEFDSPYLPRIGAE